MNLLIRGIAHDLVSLVSVMAFVTAVALWLTAI